MTPFVNPLPSPRDGLSRLMRSVWFFPALLVVILFCLTALRISGSSIGAYYNAFYGNNSKDPSLLLNHPEGIRSDEWLVTTQLTIAQSVAGYPRVNPNIDSGRDMSIVGDAPYKDWSTIFKPQNLAFFILPLEYAFAFKWWLLLTLTIISLYFLVLRFFPGKRMFAALIGTATGCSPFLFWWYATGTLGPIFYGSFIILLGMRIINGDKFTLFGGRFGQYSTLIYSLSLAYLISCFALLLYPPFQIPVGLVIVVLLAGMYIEKFGFGKKLFHQPSLGRLCTFFTGILLAGLVVFSFVHTRTNVISAIQHSNYPGVRSINSGGSPVHELFSTFLQPELQSISHAANYYTNQSEASQFILLLPFLFIPGFVLLYKERRSLRRVNWPLLATQLLITVFLLRLFFPHLNSLDRLLGLNQVPHSRLFIGLGFIGVIQLILILTSLERLKIKQRALSLHAGYYALVCLAVLAWSGQFNHDHWPIFARSVYLVGFLAIWFSLIIYSFLSKRLILGASLLFLFTMASVFHIHPLYRGLGPYYNGAIVKAIQEVSKPGDTWVNLDNLLYENAPLLANRNSLSGIKPYPDPKIWELTGDSQAKLITNRYAHVIFNSDPGLINQLVLTGPDSFQVKFACTPFIISQVKFALTPHTLDLPCATDIKEISYPNVTFYIYKIHALGQ